MLPWSAPGREPICAAVGEPFLIVPRGLPTPADWRFVLDLAGDSPENKAALLVPADMADVVPSQVPLLLCLKTVTAQC